jgi:rhodanese-related sulfurtransferase
MHQRGNSSSERAVALLRESGIQARVLDGGFTAWKAAGYPVES